MVSHLPSTKARGSNPHPSYQSKSPTKGYLRILLIYFYPTLDSPKGMGNLVSRAPWYTPKNKTKPQITNAPNIGTLPPNTARDRLCRVPPNLPASHATNQLPSPPTSTRWAPQNRIAAKQNAACGRVVQVPPQLLPGLPQLRFPEATARQKIDKGGG